MPELSEFDVSRNRDMEHAIKNLIDAEAHLIQTFAETKNKQYLEIIRAIRQIRGKVYHKILVNKDYGVWCAGKHLMSASMGLSEVGCKLIDDGKMEEAGELLVDSEDIRKIFHLLHSGKIKKT